LVECQSFLDHCRAQKVGETNTGRTRAQEEVFLIAQLSTLQFDRVDHACKYDSRRALNIVVVDAVLVAVSLKQVNSVRAGPILEVNAALWEQLLYGFNELVDKRIQFFSRRACFGHPQVQGIVQVLLVVSTCVKIHGQQVLRRYSSTGRIQLQLADG